MTEIKQIAFIVNGARPLNPNIQKTIDQCAADNALSVQIGKTTKEKEAGELSTKFSEEGVDLIVAVGGDGTVNEVMNGMMCASRKPLLAIIPNGTGNDFYRSAFNNSTSGDFLSSLKNPQIMPVDVGKIESHLGAHYFLNIADVGFGAAVVEILNRQRKYLGGKASYALAILRTFLSFKIPHLIIQSPSYQYSGPVFMVAFCNGDMFGDGLYIHPGAKVNDGVMNITLLKKIRLMDYVRNLKNLKTGKRINHPEAFYFTENELSVMVAKGKAVTETDGEHLSTAEIKITIVPLAIQLLVTEE
jgi:YegS/Rv2252/BmrU family lipid kinase